MHAKTAVTPAPIVSITENAFLQLLVSGVELYPDPRRRMPRPKPPKNTNDDPGECYGYLFGTQAMQGRRPVLRIEFVVPCQRVERRDHTEVMPSTRSEERIMTVLAPFPGLDLLGTFHSHIVKRYGKLEIPESVVPSKPDHDSWRSWWDDERKGDTALELILGVKEMKRRGAKPPTQDENCIEGRWERYAYALGVWFADRSWVDAKDDELLQPVHWLMCPTAFGITQEDFRVVGG